MPEVEVLVATLYLVGLAVVARLREGSWAAPGAAFALVWTIHVYLSLTVPIYDVWHGAVWWIFLSCLVLYLGTGVGAFSVCKHGLKRPRDQFLGRLRLHYPRIMLFGFFLTGAVYTFFAQRFQLEYWAPGIKPPLAVQFFLVGHFAGPLLGGMLFGARTLGKYWTWLSFLPLVPPALMSILLGGRMALVAPVFFWIAGYAVATVFVHRGSVRVFTKGRLILIICLVIALLLIGPGVYLLRTVGVHGEPVETKIRSYVEQVSWERYLELLRRTRPAFLGHVYSFSHYLERAWKHPPEAQLGAYIFAGPLRLMGLGPGPEPVEPFEIEPGIRWNVYTMFRPPIDDFTLWGSLVWWFLIGAVQGWAYEQVSRGYFLPAVLLSWFYVDLAIVGGYFFRYNSIILSYVVVGLYLFFSTSCSGPKE